MDTTKRQSSYWQTEAAIALFQEGKFDCAITLAAAAEGMLPATEVIHIFQVFRQEPNFEDMRYNQMINWLKHSNSPVTRADSATLTEFEATIVIARAITKFGAVYGVMPGPFRDFMNWAIDAGHLPRPSAQISD